MKKRILGLDLGTNSIGWALIEQNFEDKEGEILGLGSRIIPMSQDVLGKFDAGQSISQTAERTHYRSVRRLYQRDNLRRERLHRVLNILGFLPQHYAEAIDFDKKIGQFKEDQEPKLPYFKNLEGKFEFIFKESFEEMVSDFRNHQSQLFYIKSNGKETKIPYDWTIYYLRKKALAEKITQQELAWIILNFNQKRGYYQLRGEEEQVEENKSVKFYALKVVKVEEDEKAKNGDSWYNVHLENGWIYRRTSKTFLEWEGKIREFIVTEKLDENGKVKIKKDGQEDRSFKAVNSEEDWIAIKKSTEDKIEFSGKTVGTFIYDTLLKEPNQKIRGKLIRTIERKFYKEELKEILKKQIELQPELFSNEMYQSCIQELYPNNEAHRRSIASRDFVYLFVDDIIFYQRPLKSQKSLISECGLEFHYFIDKKTGEKKKKYIKAISKSNPYYQEFRVLQWMYNLKIYHKDDGREVTDLFVSSEEDREGLFEFLMSQKEVDNKLLLEYLLFTNLKKEYPDAKEKDIKKELKQRISQYYWNYFYDFRENESKQYPMNETGYDIRQKFEKVKSNILLTREIEYHLWHIIYSVKDLREYEKALRKFANKYNIDEASFVENFKRFKPFENSYGSLSEKAIKKLLPLMRFGKYWNYDEISKDTKLRIDDIINGVDNKDIKDNIREKIEKYNLQNESDFQGLPLWLAQYVVYNRHSEADETQKWESVEDLENYLDKFRQHSLRNPIVEQIIMETLRVVKDIWQYYGNGEKDYFDEIHIELGRDLKKTAKEREYISKQNNKNEEINIKIKEELIAFSEDKTIENIRYYSPIHQEKYKLWQEQNRMSPYTGQTIPLSKLFTDAYQIEHIIPKSRFFDDSLSNKIICEAIVNKEYKGALLGLEFIKNKGGTIVKELSKKGKEVRILSEAEYRKFVLENFSNNRSKFSKLLMEEIPEKMIERQLNDTRYISKHIAGILSKIVREDKNDDGINSKNIISCTGKITSALRKDWGLNDIWNDLIISRFERMNELSQSKSFTAKNKNGKDIPAIPLEHSKGFEKKRLDHRHHALDALVVACATREHINYMNNKHALEKGKTEKEKQELRFDLRTILCDKKYNENSSKDYNWIFKKTWETFTQDAKNALDNMVISFKQNLRVINKATNYYEKYVEENGKLVKKKVKQEGTNWAIRKPLHKETISGKITLDRIKVASGKILTATRKPLDSSFTEKNIVSITDTGIQKILLNYLSHKGSPELAFSSEGIEEMNANIAQYNGGKPHKPIYKVRVYEEGSKFSLSELGTKAKKYVEAAKGTNLYFAIYVDGNNARSYATIPLNEVIERQKQGLPSCPETDGKGNKILFSLSPNDLVYVPTEEEQETPHMVDFNHLSKDERNRIYKVVSFTGNQCFFIKYDVATTIINKKEYSPLNKMEKSIEGEMIKNVCLKLEIDRLGNILNVIGK